MVSLKKYVKSQILEEGSARFNKIASMLDPSDVDDMFKQSLSWLDQTVFSPRAVLIKPENIIEYNGGTFVDVTALKVDVINRVYYQDTFDEMLNTILPEVGLMPFLLGGSTFSSLSSVGDYLALRTNLNMMSRQLNLDGDFELWPVDDQGRQLLQVRSKKLTRIEYLPNIDRDAEEWWLYDFEYAALKDVFFDKCNVFNLEQISSAQTLGISKESTNLLEYWTKKLEADKKEFTDKSLVTALF